MRRGQPAGFKALNRAARRFFLLQAKQKIFSAGARAFDFEHDALRRIVHPPGEAKLGCQAIHKRPKANTLHRPTDCNFQPGGFFRNQTLDAGFHEFCPNRNAGLAQQRHLFWPTLYLFCNRPGIEGPVESIIDQLAQAQGCRIVPVKLVQLLLINLLWLCNIWPDSLVFNSKDSMSHR